MSESTNRKKRVNQSGKYLSIFLMTIVFIFGLFIVVGLVPSLNLFPLEYQFDSVKIKSEVEKIKSLVVEKPVFDKELYEKKMIELANNPVVIMSTSSINSTSTKVVSTSTKPTLWPAKPLVYPLAGAILPFNRVVAYYGNFYSKGMGVLGQYPPNEMLEKLKAEVKNWQLADPETPVVPAIHYIAVTAQGSAVDGKYRLRMPSDQIDEALRLAKEVNGLVFLDIQVALSNVQIEVPLLEKYLKMPNVHLGLDPEFSMKTGAKPGTVIGTMDATDINYVANYLAKLVRENDLPPKILVIHRFTKNMVTNYKLIKPLPEVQIVMDMDGWGTQAKKKGTYNQIIYPEPIQFTGFKLFYKNDVKNPGTTLLTPAQVLELRPKPIYIQYQ